MSEAAPSSADVETALARISDQEMRNRAVHEFKTIRRIVGGRFDWMTSRLLDFGCGHRAIAAASFALRYPKAKVFGADIVEVDRGAVEALYKEKAKLALADNLSLECVKPGKLPSDIADLDLIYAWSVFEHVRFDQIVPTMRLLRSRLKSNGYLFIQINPLYFSPRGSHLYRYLTEPWAHLLHQTDVLRAAVMASKHAQARKEREWEQFLTLNRATAEDIIEAAELSGFAVVEQERLRADIEIPERLTRVYLADALSTEEIRLLLRIPG